VAGLRFTSPAPRSSETQPGPEPHDR
jgi:hypothetical protein